MTKNKNKISIYSKVIEVNYKEIKFDNGLRLYSNHHDECCESHYLSFEDLKTEDFEDLEFDLTNDNFFKKIDDYGIELIPVKGYSIKIAGYGFNNGYYSSELELVLTDGKEFRQYDISDCQKIDN